MNATRNPVALLLCALAAVHLGAAPAGAANLTWNNGSGNGFWDPTSYNWLMGTIPTTYSDGDDVTFGAAGLGPITIQGGGVQPHSINVTQGGYEFSGGPIAGSTGLNAPGGWLTLHNANTFSGGVTFGGGYLKIGDDQALGSGKLMGNAIICALGGNRSIANDIEASAINLSGAWDVGLHGNLSLWGGLDVDPARTLDISGPISGAYVNKTNSGTLILSGLNTFTGGFSVYYGTVLIPRDAPNAAPGALGNSSQNVQVWSTASLLVTGSYTVGRPITVDASLSSAGKIGGQHTSGTATFSGPITLTGTGTPTFTSAAGGRVEFTGEVSDGTSSVLLNKVGAGVVALYGASTYDGGTAVTQGTLLVNNTTGSGTGTGMVIVGNQATLGGMGVIGGPLRIELGGILSPGEGPGMLSMGGLELRNTSRLLFELAEPASVADDLLRVTGNLKLDGVLDVSALSGFGVGTYTLMTYTGSLIDNGLDFGSLPGGYPYQISAGSGLVSLTVVPEPSSWVLLAVGGVALAAWVFCRRR
jgi:autotransporter-associated beta strand protein